MVLGLASACGLAAQRAQPGGATGSLSPAKQAEWLRVVDWVDALVRRGVNKAPYPPLRVTYEEYMTYVPPAAEMSALREGVKREPRSIAAISLKNYEKALAGRPERLVSNLWLMGPTRFRRSYGFAQPGESPEYPVDVVHDAPAGLNWQLLRQNGRLTRGSRAQIEYLSEFETQVFSQEVIDFVAPGFGWMMRSEVESHGVVVDDAGEGVYRVDFVTPDNGGTNASIFFTWDAAKSSPVVSRCVLRPNTTFSDEIGLDFSYSGHEWRDFAGGYVARSVLHRNAEGAECRRVEVTEIAELTESEFKLVSKVPKPGAEDAVRGRLSEDWVMFEKGPEELGIELPAELLGQGASWMDQYAGILAVFIGVGAAAGIGVWWKRRSLSR